MPRKQRRKKAGPRGSRRDSAKPVAAAGGRRVGTKKSDRRWQSEDGQIWASKLESDIFYGLQAKGVDVRRCDERDSVPYTTRIRGGHCRQCNAKDVCQEHTYTPDLLVASSPALPKEVRGYIEAKGYLRAADRRVLRGVIQARPQFDLCLVLQRYHADTVHWARKFLKVPVFIWSAKDGLVGAP